MLPSHLTVLLLLLFSAVQFSDEWLIKECNTRKLIKILLSLCSNIGDYDYEKRSLGGGSSVDSKADKTLSNNVPLECDGLPTKACENLKKFLETDVSMLSGLKEPPKKNYHLEKRTYQGYCFFSIYVLAFLSFVFKNEVFIKIGTKKLLKKKTPLMILVIYFSLNYFLAHTPFRNAPCATIVLFARLFFRLSQRPLSFLISSLHQVLLLLSAPEDNYNCNYC